MAKEKVSRKDTYYATQRMGHFTPGEEVDLAAYSDRKLKSLIESGIISTSPPKTEEEEDEEVPPTDAADAMLPPERRSAEATGQPNPSEEIAARNTGQPVEPPKRGRPANS